MGNQTYQTIMTPINKILVSSNVFKYKLTPYLSVIDLYNFYVANINNNMVMGKIYDSMIDALRKQFTTIITLSVDYGKNNIIQLLDKYNCIISGSSILHAVHEESMWANDIDVYFKNETDFDNFVQESGYTVTLEYDVKRKITYVHGYSAMSRIISVHKIEGINKYAKSFQCIVLDGVDIEEYIIKEYDYDIIKNILYFRNGVMQFKFHKLHDVMTKTTRISDGGSNVPHSTFPNRFPYRLEKYVKKKGITFNAAQSFDQIYKYYSEHLPQTIFTSIYDIYHCYVNDGSIFLHKHDDKTIVQHKSLCSNQIYGTTDDDVPDSCILQLLDIDHYHTVDLLRSVNIIHINDPSIDLSNYPTIADKYNMAEITQYNHIGCYLITTNKN